MYPSDGGVAMATNAERTYYSLPRPAGGRDRTMDPRRPQASAPSYDVESSSMFREIDRNQDGVISAREFKLYRDRVSPHEADVTSGQAYNVIDSNRDGAVTLPEFRRYRQAADADRDGHLTETEVVGYERAIRPLVQQDPRIPKETGYQSWLNSPVGAAPSAMQIRAPQAASEPEDSEVLEFLEGLLEGFRAATGLNAAPAEDWGILDQLEPLNPGGPRNLANVLASGRQGNSALQPFGEADAQDPLSQQMRRHALRAFLEEMCDTVANAFDVLAGLALRSALGGPGTQQDRLRHMLTEHELRATLSQLGYGSGAAGPWWHALFLSLDVDQNGAISLQDMYDALVLHLQPDPPGPDADRQRREVFFAPPAPREEATWRRRQTNTLVPPPPGY